MTEFDISKTTINFKIDVVNFINQYPGIRKSSISLFYLKSNFRAIKNVCQEHASEYKKGSWYLLAEIGTFLLRMPIFYSCFFFLAYFAGKCQLFGFFIIGTLVKNGLRKRYILI